MTQTPQLVVHTTQVDKRHNTHHPLRGRRPGVPAPKKRELLRSGVRHAARFTWKTSAAATARKNGGDGGGDARERPGG